MSFFVWVKSLFTTSPKPAPFKPKVAIITKNKIGWFYSCAGITHKYHLTRGGAILEAQDNGFQLFEENGKRFTVNG